MAKETESPRRLLDAESVLAETAEHLQQEAEHQGEVLRDREMVADTLEERAGLVADRLSRTGMKFEAQLIEELLTEIGVAFDDGREVTR